jgi:hypothetical protein
MWTGANEDIRQIATKPIPSNFEQAFNSKPCNSLDKTALVTWHLRFGDEQTTAAALDYLEAKMGGSVTPAAFMRDADQAWKAALPIYQAAAMLRNTPDGYRPWLARLQADRRSRHMHDIGMAYEGFVFLAQEYLRAAEFYRSPALLEKARKYLSPALEGVRLFFNDADVAMADSREPPVDFALWSHDINTVRDMQMRAAVLQAILTPTPEALEAARSTLATADEPMLRSAAQEAFENGRNFCDGSDDLEVKSACDTENSFERRVRAYWRARAKFALVTNGPEAERRNSLDLAMKLLSRAGDESDWTPDLSSMRDAEKSDQLAELFVMEAEAAEKEANGVDQPESWPAREKAALALKALVNAERRASPVWHPARFRQIAAQYLRIYDRYAKSVEAVPWDGGQWGRQAIYMQSVVNTLPLLSPGTP